MKLLLDENLSRRLVPLLQERYPGTSQVALLGCERSTDLQIWGRARTDGYVIVTCDADFQEISLVMGAPPHVIWLKGGNHSNEDVLKALSNHHATILQAIEVGGLACVEISAIR